MQFKANYSPDAKPSDVTIPVGADYRIQELAREMRGESVPAQLAELQTDSVQEVVLQSAKKRGVFKEVPLDMLTHTPAAWNKFTPISDDMKVQLAQSIMETGLQQPIVVRELDAEPSCYQVLAGNTRMDICRILLDATGDTSFSSIPAIVYSYGEIDDETARQIVVDTNYAQRGELPKRDKMFAIHEKLSFLRKRKEKDSMQRVAEMINVSRSTVYFWDSIHNLVPELFEIFEHDAINIKMAAKLGTYEEDVQCQLATVKDMLTNEIIKLLPPYLRAEEALDVFNSVLESETMPKEEAPRGEWHVKRTARSIHVTVTGKHDAYEPYVVLIPKKKAKSFVKKYDEFILRPDEAEENKEENE